MTPASPLVFASQAFVLAATFAWGIAFLIWLVVRTLPTNRQILLSSNSWFILGTLPFLTAIAFGSAALIAASLKSLSVIPDHCMSHPHHPHLCWSHSFQEGTLFWISLIGGVGISLAGLIRLWRTIARTRRRLRLAWTQIDEDGLCIIQSRIPTIFVEGILRPKVYLTSAADQLLSPKERRIVTAHERLHIQRLDPLRMAILRLASYMFPGFSQMEENWKIAAEIECDSASLQEGVTPEEVTLTIVKLARSLRSEAEPQVLAYSPNAESTLRQRVEGLLSGNRLRQRSCRVGRIAGIILMAAVAILSSAHHVLETFLGKVF